MCMAMDMAPHVAGAQSGRHALHATRLVGRCHCLYACQPSNPQAQLRRSIRYLRLPHGPSIPSLPQYHRTNPAQEAAPSTLLCCIVAQVPLIKRQRLHFCHQSVLRALLIEAEGSNAGSVSKFPLRSELSAKANKHAAKRGRGCSGQWRRCRQLVRLCCALIWIWRL